MRRLTVVLCILANCGFLLAADPGVPHPNDPVLRSEHQAMLELVRADQATFVAERDGAWSAAATWTQHAVPAAGAIVLIPSGRTVTVDGQTAALRAVRVEGKLTFATTGQSTLTLDTLLIAPGGELEIGSAEHPIASNATARIVFSDAGPIDTARDPLQMGRGLIAHGTVRMHGAALTPFAQLTRAPHHGDASIALTSPPINWKKGDRLIIPATHYGQADEKRTILSINGAEASIAPLDNDHLSPGADVPVYVANLTRNVVIESADGAEVSRRGHVMLMHNPNVQLRYVAFSRLGRTDKSKPIADPELDESGKLVAGSGSNPRGRYAVHFHRTGTLPEKATAVVAGCAVIDSAGWGYVNHSSRVDFNDNVSFNVVGSGFVTEAGDEAGTFRHNLAIASKGSTDDEDERRKFQDFGHEGDGFWFQGAGVTVEDNIACGQHSSGFIYFTIGLIEPGLGTARFATANFWNDSLASTVRHIDEKDKQRIDDPKSVPVIAVPVKSFKRNTAYACKTGFTARFMQPKPNRSAFEDGLAWNCQYGVRVRYTSHLDLRNLRLIGDTSNKVSTAAIDGTLEGDQDLLYQNLRVEGWPIGLYVPEVGHQVVVGGYYNNAKSIYIPSPMARDRKVEITGDIKFGSLDGARTKSEQQYDIYLEARFNPMLDGPKGGYRDPNILFANDIIRMDAAPHAGTQLYFKEQAGSYVPFPRNPSQRDMKQLGATVGAVPDRLIDLTNEQMMQKYALAIGGAIAPANATTAPRIHGLIGAPTQYHDEYRLADVRTTAQKGFSPICFAAKTKQHADVTAVDLTPGWNVITQTIDGRRTSFLIFSGESKMYTGAKPGKYGYAK